MTNSTPAVVRFTVSFTAADVGGSQSSLDELFPTQGAAEEAARMAASLDPDYCADWRIEEVRKELWQYHADEEARWIALLQG